MFDVPDARLETNDGLHQASLMLSGDGAGQERRSLVVDPECNLGRCARERRQGDDAIHQRLRCGRRSLAGSLKTDLYLRAEATLVLPGRTTELIAGSRLALPESLLHVAELGRCDVGSAILTGEAVADKIAIVPADELPLSDLGSQSAVTRVELRCHGSILSPLTAVAGAPSLVHGTGGRGTGLTGVAARSTGLPSLPSSAHAATLLASPLPLVIPEQGLCLAFHRQGECPQHRGGYHQT